MLFKQKVCHMYSTAAFIESINREEYHLVPCECADRTVLALEESPKNRRMIGLDTH